MALAYKHWEVDKAQLERISADPDSIITRADEAVLHFLTLPQDKRSYALGYFAIGRFEVAEDGNRGDCLHTGSFGRSDFQELARGTVVEDFDNPDGLYEVYVPI